MARGFANLPAGSFARALFASSPLLVASACKGPAPSLPKENAAGIVRFAVIGDFGADTTDEARVASMVKSWNPDFVLTTGDNNYPSGEASTIDANIGKHYASFIGGYRGAFGQGGEKNRFWPSLGNHDWVAGAGPYLDYFTLPGNERYYDVDLGIVHLYALDSDPHEPDGISLDSTQAGWLRARLAASRSCYDVVFFHHAPFSSGRHGPTTSMQWPFREWGAEVVLAGHDHTYERLTIDGIPYFVNGLGGAPKYAFQSHATPGSQVRFNEGFGAMLISASAKGITYEFYDDDRVKRDSLTVPPPGRCPVEPSDPR